MTKNEIIDYFLTFKGSILTFPFDDVTEVFKVGNKMFGLISKRGAFDTINLKGLPDDNIALRNMFSSITPGFHMNKEHWNTIILDGTLEDELIKRLISESYDIVFNKLSLKARNSLG